MNYLSVGLAQYDAALTPPANNVTVNFGGDYTYRVYDPLVGLNAIASGNGRRVGVNVSGSPLLIQISPHENTADLPPNRYVF